MKTWPVVTAMFFAAGVALAEEPTTAPSQPGVKKVIVLPFEGSGDATNYAIVGKAVQHGIDRELSSENSIQTILVSGPATQTPVDQARDQAAQFVISGIYQVEGKSLRISGSVQSSDGKSVGDLKATGNLQDLFALEDEVSEQAKRAVTGRKAATLPVTLAEVARAKPETPASPLPPPTEVRGPYQDPTLYYPPYSNPPVNYNNPGFGGYGVPGAIIPPPASPPPTTAPSNPAPQPSTPPPAPAPIVSKPISSGPPSINPPSQKGRGGKRVDGD